MALPAACMCVCIHLERVASVRLVRTSVEDKRRRQIIEAVLCFGLPCLWMVLCECIRSLVFSRLGTDDSSVYIVQGHRFDIIEEYGCRPATFVSIPAIFLLWVPPLILAFVTMVFASMSIFPSTEDLY